MGLFAFNLARKKAAEEAAKAASAELLTADKKAAGKPAEKQAKPAEK